MKDSKEKKVATSHKVAERKERKEPDGIKEDINENKENKVKENLKRNRKQWKENH